MSAKQPTIPVTAPRLAQSPAEVREIIARSRPEDYDGHTEFARLTPRERLEWLDSAVALIEAARARKPTAS